MTPIRYGLWLRLTDAYHGWRDGRAEIPSKPSIPAPITTGHREALIRLAQEAFTSEELEYRKLAAEPHRQIMAERARLATAEARLAWARAVFDRTPATLTAAQAKRRRLGEEHHPETIIVQRRQREHLKLRARDHRAVERIQAEIGAIRADLADAEDQARQQHQVVVARVERIHEHIHHRLAVYRRALVRFHPDGAWANAVLSVRAPEIPGWALPDAYLPESPRRRRPPPPEPDLREEREEERPVTIIPLWHAVTKFGSAQAPEGDDEVGYVTLASPIAAKWHFTIVKTADGLLELKSRGYGRGPYLGGEIPGSVVLKPGDSFEFADRRYTMLDAHRLEDASLGKSDLIVADLSAKSGSKSRLSHMSFVQREGTLLAVIGPSGAGKSSLIYALLGELPLGSGRLFFRTMSMATHAKQIRESAGFVPQGTELHKSLTVEATLRYGARLRSGAAKAVRSQAVADAIRETELQEVRHQPLSTLSGGQYRRVSIALELLTGPPLLMLDEPTSGLDANLDRQIMRLLSRLAGEGRTVIVVTHATEHLYLADQVLAVIKGGTPAYAGSPRPMQRRFGFETYADFLDMLNANYQKLSDQYQSGHMAEEACRAAGDLEQRITAGPASGSQAGRGRPTALRLLPLRFWVLTVRQCALLLTRAQSEKAPERWRQLKNGFFFCLPLMVAVLSAALAAFVAGSPGLGAVPSPVGPTALALLTTLCVLSGQALTYSDVVSELPVIGREFRAGVGAFPVLAAKWLVYAVLAVAQAALITVVFCRFPDRAPQRSIWLGPEVDLFIGLAALSIATMSLGMLISTLASKLEHAVALITVTSIAQIALNGVTSDLSQRSITSVVAALLPDRWGLAATASSVDLRGINEGHPTQVSPDALWNHTLGQWFTDLCALGLLCIIFFSLAVWRLHAKFRLPKAVHKHPRT